MKAGLNELIALFQDPRLYLTVRESPCVSRGGVILYAMDRERPDHIGIVRMDTDRLPLDALAGVVHWMPPTVNERHRDEPYTEQFARWAHVNGVARLTTTHLPIARVVFWEHQGTGAHGWNTYHLSAARASVIAQFHAAEAADGVEVSYELRCGAFRACWSKIDLREPVIRLVDEESAAGSTRGIPVAYIRPHVRDLNTLEAELAVLCYDRA